MTSTFDTPLTSLTHLFESLSQPRPMAAIVSKYKLITFAHAKAYVTKFDFDVK